MEMYRKRGGRIKTITSGEGSWERRREGERERMCVKVQRVHICVCAGDLLHVLFRALHIYPVQAFYIRMALTLLLVEYMSRAK